MSDPQSLLTETELAAIAERVRLAKSSTHPSMLAFTILDDDFPDLLAGYQQLLGWCQRLADIAMDKSEEKTGYVIDEMVQAIQRNKP